MGWASIQAHHLHCKHAIIPSDLPEPTQQSPYQPVHERASDCFRLSERIILSQSLQCDLLPSMHPTPGIPSTPSMYTSGLFNCLIQKHSQSGKFGRVSKHTDKTFELWQPSDCFERLLRTASCRMQPRARFAGLKSFLSTGGTAWRGESAHPWKTLCTSISVLVQNMACKIWFYSIGT